jgi:hypothetical protein
MTPFEAEAVVRRVGDRVATDEEIEWVIEAVVDELLLGALPARLSADDPA